MVQQNYQEERLRVPRTRLRVGIRREERENLCGEYNGDRDGKTFGQLKKTSFIVIILNREFNFTRQEKNHSLFLQDLHY